MDDMFTDEIQKEQQLYDQLATCLIFEMTGIVSASGVGESKLPGQKLWSLIITFDAWRVGSGPVRTESITIRRKVSTHELRSLKNAINPKTVIKIRARLPKENIFKRPQALLEEFIGTDSTDSELHDYLMEIQKPEKPVTREDDFFGTLIFDPSEWHTWYADSVKWNGKPVKLSLEAEGSKEFDLALKVAHVLWDNETLWNERIRDYAVQELLPLKNESWLGEHETELSPDQFKNRMEPEFITMYPDGSFEFLFNVGDMFLGHFIEVDGDLSDGLTGAVMQG
jgi:hypothetical protein